MKWESTNVFRLSTSSPRLHFLIVSFNLCKTIGFPCVLGSIVSLVVTVHWSNFQRKYAILWGLLFQAYHCSLQKWLPTSTTFPADLVTVDSSSAGWTSLASGDYCTLPVYWHTADLRLESCRRSCCWSYSYISFLIWASLLCRYSQRLFSWL